METAIPTKSRVALVTGGSRGLGRTIAEEFASRGYAVAVNYNKSSAAAQELAAYITKNGGRAAVYRADISDSRAVRAMIKSVSADFGRLDAVVNNAAIIRDRTLKNMTDSEWDEVLSVDLSGAFYVTREAAKIMARLGGGAIINVSSAVGVRGNIGEANYSAAKGALISFGKSAARELGRFGIRVNCVLPGFHLTDMGRSAPAEYYEKNKAESVLKTTTDAGELARFVVFLSELKTVSGQVFNVDSRII